MGLKSKYSPLSKPSFENLYTALVNLRQREQLIALGVGIALVVALFVMPLSLVSGKVSQLKKRIAQSQSKYHEVLDKIGEFVALEAETRTLEKRLSGSVSAMSSTIETLAKRAKLQGNIEVLKEKPAVPGERFSELPVELKLTNVTLEKLVDLVYSIESYPTALLRIRSIQVNPKATNRAFLDVTMDIANISLREGT